MTSTMKQMQPNEKGGRLSCSNIQNNRPANQKPKSVESHTIPMLPVPKEKAPI